MNATAATGLLVIDKPAGVTSHDVVSRVRRILGMRRVGHAGTLDPMATGVLLVGVGQATRLLGYLARSDKEYLATIRLGAATLTDDATGPILRQADPGQVADLDMPQVQSQVERLIGDLMQVPSSVSAIKIAGKRAYSRVRAGDEVHLAARPVQVTALQLLAWRRAESWLDVDVRVACSTGTYVRALARDLGEALEVGGHLTALRRTRVGSWRAGEAVELEALQADPNPADRLVSMEQAAIRSFPVQVVDGVHVEDVRHGRPIPLATGTPDSPTAVMDGGGRLLALASSDGSRARYLAVLAT